MRFSNLLAGAALCAVAFPQTSLAQGAPDDAGEIVVTASGIAQPRSETGKSISVLDRERLDTLQSATITDALRTLPSVAVAQRGPVGSQTSVFLRGGNSAQTLVLVDGVRINDPSSPNGAFDFGALQAGNFERIELLRGANSVIWGSQAIGGVISLTSFIPTDRLAVRAVAEGGQADTVRTSANISGSSGILAGSIGGGWYRSAGISALTGGTERDGHDAVHANGRLEIALGDNAAIDLRGFYNRGRVEYDSPFGLGADALPESRNRQFTAYVGARAALFDGGLINRIAYTRTDIDRLGTDPVAFSFNNFDISGSVDRFTYQGEWNVGSMLTLLFGAEHEETRTSTSFEDAAADIASNNVTGGYGQFILRPLDGLTVTGGVRHDDYSDYGGQTTFAANAAFTPNGGATLLRASFAEGFRAPTLSEGQPPFGNPALRPETARNFDVGVEQKLLDDRAAIGFTWFRRTSDDLIAFSFATFQSENIDRARASGIEIELALRPSDRVDIRANWSRVDALNKTPGPLFNKRLALRPQDSITLTADWRTPWTVRVGTTINVTGDSFDNADNSVRLDGFTLVALRAALPLTAGIEAFARVENLFDERYATVAGYSTYGRGAFAGGPLVTMMRGGVATVAAMVLAGCGTAPPAPAPRPLHGVISLDYCADQMVLGLVPRANILGVSPEADSDTSFAAPRAQGIARIRPMLEEIAAHRPRHVVRMYGGAPGIDRQLQALGITVVQLQPAGRLADVPSELARVGAALDVPARAQALSDRFSDILVQSRAPDGGPRPTLLYATPGDVTTGGDGFVGELIRVTGFRSVRAVPGWGSLPLEAMVGRPPDAMLRAFFDSPRYRQDRWSSSAHPLLRQMTGNIPTATVPGSALGCGNWLAGDALLALARLRRQVRSTS